MLPYQYFYIIWTFIFLVIWAFFFLSRKDTRREMLIMSFIFGVGGLLSQWTHIADWWQPITISGTMLGPEDFLIGFAIGGVASAIYENIFHKRGIHPHHRVVWKRDSYAFLCAFGFLFLLLFYVFSIDSGHSALYAYLASIGVMLFKRRDLIIDSLLSGVLMLIVGIGIYQILFLVYPDYINEFWYLPDVWYSKLIWGLPLGEYVWYFLTGAFIGPVYEFIEGLQITSLGNKQEL